MPIYLIVWLFLGLWAWKRYCDRQGSVRNDGELVALVGIILLGPVCFLVDALVWLETKRR